jgi:glycerate-2-kinase
MGTDGIDGPTDAAGAMADSDVFQSSCDKGLYIGDYLDNNDAYVFFEQTGGLIKTGPTGTNLMDIAALLVT